MLSSSVSAVLGTNLVADDPSGCGREAALSATAVSAITVCVGVASTETCGGSLTNPASLTRLGDLSVLSVPSIAAGVVADTEGGGGEPVGGNGRVVLDTG